MHHIQQAFSCNSLTSVKLTRTRTSPEDLLDQAGSQSKVDSVSIFLQTLVVIPLIREEGQWCRKSVLCVRSHPASHHSCWQHCEGVITPMLAPNLKEDSNKSLNVDGVSVKILHHARACNESIQLATSPFPFKKKSALETRLKRVPSNVQY